MKIKLIIKSAVFSVPLLCFSASAQYISSSELRELNRAQEENKVLAEFNKHVGKTFWVMPDPKAAIHVEFYTAPKLLSESFRVTQKSSFVVREFVPGSSGKFARVEFPDGKEGYVFLDGDKLPNLYTGGKTSGFSEFIYPKDPELLASEASAKAKQASVSNKARPQRTGVTLGMTKEQVLQSSWGKPGRVNRSVGRWGVHEQWVYGSNSYLYFENGVLTSLQN